MNIHSALSKDHVRIHIRNKGHRYEPARGLSINTYGHNHGNLDDSFEDTEPIEICTENISDQDIYDQVNMFQLMDQYVDIEQVPVSLFGEITEFYYILNVLLGDITDKLRYHLHSVVYYVLSASYISSILYKIRKLQNNQAYMDEKKRV